MIEAESIDSKNNFSVFNRGVHNLDVHVSVLLTNIIRVTIRDANAQRYEVPVPIQWNPSTPSSFPATIKFQMTNTSNGQVGFRSCCHIESSCS
jgi:hypothetical protein